MAMSVVGLGDVCEAAVGEMHAKLTELAGRLTPHLLDLDRRKLILAYLAHVRGLLLRLLVIVRWAEKGGITQLRDWTVALNEAEEQSNMLRRAADTLYFLHEVLPRSCAPPYDVRAAMEVLGTGRYTQLPRALQAPEPPKPPTKKATAAALHWLRGVLRVRRTAWRLPEGMTLREAQGCILCKVAGEYEMALSAQPQPEAPWRLLRLRRLVTSEPSAATTSRWEKLKVSIQQKLDQLPPQPLLEVHPEIHQACCALALVALHSQAIELIKGQWGSGLKVELRKLADGTPSVLRLAYTFHEAANMPSATSDPSAPPSKKRRLEPGTELNVGAGEAVLEVRPSDVCGVVLWHSPPLWQERQAAEAEEPCGLSEQPPLWMDELHVEALLLYALRERSIAQLLVLQRTLGGGLELDECGALPALVVSDSHALAVQPRDGKLVHLGSTSGLPLTTETADVMLSRLRLHSRRAEILRAAFAIGAVGKPPPTFLAEVESASTTKADPATPAAGILPSKPTCASFNADASKALADASPFKKVGGVGGPQWKPLDASAVREGRLAELWLELPRLVGWAIHARLAAAENAVATDFWLIQLPVDNSNARVIPIPKRAIRLPVSRATLKESNAARSIEQNRNAATLMEMHSLHSLVLTLGTTSALQDQLKAAGLSGELTADHTIHLAPLPASACCPPLPSEMLGPHLRVAPLLSSLPGSGWQATINLLEKPKCSDCDFGEQCPSGGVLHFDTTGCHFRYSSVTPTSLRSLLLDLQALAMVRSILCRIGEFREASAPGMAGLRVLNASCAGILLLTETKRRVSLVCGGSETESAIPLSELISTRPLLQMHMRIDGALPPASTQAVLSRFTRNASVVDVLTCDALVPLRVMC